MAGTGHGRDGDLGYDAEGRKVIELAKLNLASDHLETGIGRYDALNTVGLPVPPVLRLSPTMPTRHRASAHWCWGCSAR